MAIGVGLAALLPAEHVRPSVRQLIADGSISGAGNAQLVNEAAERLLIDKRSVQHKLASYERELGWQAWPRADEMAAALAAHDEGGAADKLRACHNPDSGWVHYCPNDPEHYWEFRPERCWLRICPSCAKAIAQRLRVRYAGRIAQVERQNVRAWSLKKIELTIKREGELKAQLGLLHRGSKKLFKHFWGDDKRAGAFAALEIGPKGGNVHVHMIVYGRYVDQAAISNYWRKLTDNYIVWVKRVSAEQAISEGIKYCTKFAKSNDANDFVLSNDDLLALHLALKGKRRVWAWGKFYGLADDIEQDEPPAAACPECSHRLAWSSRAEVRSHLILTTVIKCSLSSARAAPAVGPPAVGPPFQHERG